MDLRRPGRARMKIEHLMAVLRSYYWNVTAHFEDRGFRNDHDGIGYSSTDYHAGTVPVAK
jgi:hypothetical protein